MSDIGNKTDMVFENFVLNKDKSNGSNIFDGEIRFNGSVKKIQVTSNYHIYDEYGKTRCYSEIRAAGHPLKFHVEVEVISNCSRNISTEEIQKTIEEQCLASLEDDVKKGYIPKIEDFNPYSTNIAGFEG